ncbi:MULTISPECIES: GxxExxY protein [Novilysobacter]|uniref:GxxExxY protein n=1 Tax=Novilysobacter TaxID=3382699 RepID=UPI002ED9E51D
MDTDKSRIIEKALTDKVIGGFYAVYNELGAGYLESVYENALVIALAEAGLAVAQQAALKVRFRSHVVGEFRVDLLVEGRLIVEVKAVSQLAPAHEVQLVNYLKSSGIALGLLLNFGPRPNFKRRILSPALPTSDSRQASPSTPTYTHHLP